MALALESRLHGSCLCLLFQLISAKAMVAVQTILYSTAFGNALSIHIVRKKGRFFAG